MKHVQKLSNWTFCGKPVSRMASVVAIDEINQFRHIEDFQVH
jgi:hypothetical protein